MYGKICTWPEFVSWIEPPWLYPIFPFRVFSTWPKSPIYGPDFLSVHLGQIWRPLWLSPVNSLSLKVYNGILLSNLYFSSFLSFSRSNNVRLRKRNTNFILRKWRSKGEKVTSSLPRSRPLSLFISPFLPHFLLPFLSLCLSFSFLPHYIPLPPPPFAFP